MDAEELLRSYAAGERDFRGVDLSGDEYELLSLKLSPDQEQKGQ